MLAHLADALGIDMAHLPRSTSYKATAMKTFSFAFSEDGVTVLGVLFLVATLCSHQNAKADIQQKVLRLLRALFVPCCNGCFAIAALRDLDWANLVVEEGCVSLASWKRFLTTGKLTRKRGSLQVGCCP
jgi:hypothetical protein